MVTTHTDNSVCELLSWQTLALPPSKQEHILPYMADPRHAPDTLFFVVEEDFRLFARHSICAPGALAKVAESAYAASSTAYNARTPYLAESLNEPVALSLDAIYEWRYEHSPVIPSGAELFGAPALGTDSWKQIIGGLYAPKKKPTQEEVSRQGPSEYLEDMVRMVTAASREGLGNLVWLSYDAFKRKGFRCRVCHAATLIAVSAQGAKRLLELVETNQLGNQHHWDIMLLRWLQSHGNEFGASYVYPSMGHYQAHLSGSSDTEGWRDAQWKQEWIQEGTRAGHCPAGRTRWLMGWCEKGLDWKRAVMLPERGEDLRWFTRTSAPEGWISAQTAARRSAVALAKGRGKGKVPPILIQPFFTKGATEMADDPELTTARRKRARRAQNRDYAFRIFASEGQRVV